MKEVQIRSLVRRQIIDMLQEDLDGGETLKEVWELCATSDLDEAAKRELTDIIELLREREQQLGEG
jgi:hypothetical protein